MVRRLRPIHWPLSKHDTSEVDKKDVGKQQVVEASDRVMDKVARRVKVPKAEVVDS